METEVSYARPGASPPAADPPAAKAATSLDALTGLRFLAAMGVVLYHFALPILKDRSYILTNIASDGFIAVDLFYLLSGFILSYSYLNKEGVMRGNRRSFYISRFARIYPAYFLAFVMAAPSNIVTSLHANRMIIGIAKLLINAGLVLTLQQAWTPWTAWGWNYPAWSVSVEVFFYLLFPWIGVRLARLGTASSRKLACLLWLLALSAPFLLWVTKGTTGPPLLGDRLQMAIEFTPIFRLPEFLLGILLGRAYVLGQFSRINGNWLVSIAAISLFVGLGFCPFIPHPLLANGLFLPFFALLIAGLAQGRGPLAWFLSRPFMVMLGEASYSIYILQLPLALLLKTPPPVYSLRAFCFYCAMLLICSVLIWHFVETPLRKSIRGWLGSHAQ